MCNHRESLRKCWFYCFGKTKYLVELDSIFEIRPPRDNPGISQQSVASNGIDEVYVVFPSDEGSKIGVVQIYDLLGNKTREISNVDVSHASASTYIDGKLFVLGTKNYQIEQEVCIIDLQTGFFETKKYNMPDTLIWESLSSLNDTLFFIGMDGTGNTFKKGKSPRKNPSIIELVAFYQNKMVYKQRQSFKPPFEYETTQALLVKKNEILMLSSGYEQEGVSRTSLFISNKTMSWQDFAVYPIDIFPEPEGMFLLSGNVYLSLYRRGLYGMKYYERD